MDNFENWWNEQKNSQEKNIAQINSIKQEISEKMSCNNFDELKELIQILNKKYGQKFKTNDDIWKNAQKDSFISIYDFTYTVQALSILNLVNAILDYKTWNSSITEQLNYIKNLGYVILDSLLDLNIYFKMELIYDDEYFFGDEEQYFELNNKLCLLFINEARERLESIKEINADNRISKKLSRILD